MGIDRHDIGQAPQSGTAPHLRLVMKHRGYDSNPVLRKWEEQKYQKLMAERIRAAKSVLPKAASPSKRKAGTREAPVPADASPQQPVPAADQSLMQHSMCQGGGSRGRQPMPHVPLRYRESGSEEDQACDSGLRGGAGEFLQLPIHSSQQVSSPGGLREVRQISTAPADTLRPLFQQQPPAGAGAPGSRFLASSENQEAAAGSVSPAQPGRSRALGWRQQQHQHGGHRTPNAQHRHGRQPAAGQQRGCGEGAAWQQGQGAEQQQGWGHHTRWGLGGAHRQQVGAEQRQHWEGGGGMGVAQQQRGCSGPAPEAPADARRLCEPGVRQPSAGSGQQRSRSKQRPGVPGRPAAAKLREWNSSATVEYQDPMSLRDEDRLLRRTQAQVQCHNRSLRPGIAVHAPTPGGGRSRRLQENRGGAPTKQQGAAGGPARVQPPPRSLLGHQAQLQGPLAVRQAAHCTVPHIVPSGGRSQRGVERGTSGPKQGLQGKATAAQAAGLSALASHVESNAPTAQDNPAPPRCPEQALQPASLTASSRSLAAALVQEATAAEDADTPLLGDTTGEIFPSSPAEAGHMSPNHQSAVPQARGHGHMSLDSLYADESWCSYDASSADLGRQLLRVSL